MPAVSIAGLRRSAAALFLMLAFVAIMISMVGCARQPGLQNGSSCYEPDQCDSLNCSWVDPNDKKKGKECKQAAS
jgi:hypothetical protein